LKVNITEEKWENMYNS